MLWCVAFFSGDNQSQPGDPYHPDFCQSSPAFFDASVHNTLSSSIISHVSVSAGAAGYEAFKDKHNIVATGGQFYPLIVETFRIWAVDTLTNIAARLTAQCRRKLFD